MDTWLAWKMLVSSIILISGTESCATVYNGTIDEVTEANTKSPWLLLIINKVETKDHGILGISYGSLIKEDVVLTSASEITSFSLSQLEVVINWQTTVETSCHSRLITSIEYPPNFDKNKVKPSDWALLILNEPFELDDKVSIIPLADKSHQWDAENCYIYRWIFVIADYKVKARNMIAEGLLHREYHVSLTPGSSGLDKKDMAELFYELDSIMKDYEVIDEKKRINKTISFVGSPIVCKLLNRDQYVQVGLTTFVAQWSLHATINHLDIKDITKYDEDNFVDLIKDFDEVIVPSISKD